MPAQRPPANRLMSIKLITAPPWIEPPMFMCASVGNIRQQARPGPSGLNSSRPVAAAKELRGKSPQLNQPGWSGSACAPRGTPTSEPGRSAALYRSSGPLRDQLLGLGDRLGRVEALGADVGAVHDRVAAIEPERVLKLVEPLAGRLVAAVGQPAIGLQQDRRAEETGRRSTNSSGSWSSSRSTGCTRRGRRASRGPRATAAAPCPTAPASTVFSHGWIEAYCA